MLHKIWLSRTGRWGFGGLGFGITKKRHLKLLSLLPSASNQLAVLDLSTTETHQSRHGAPGPISRPDVERVKQNPICFKNSFRIRDRERVRKGRGNKRSRIFSRL